MQFTVRLDGRVSDVVLSQSSGHPALDAVARALPEKAQPLPLPDRIPQRLEVPIRVLPR